MKKRILLTSTFLTIVFLLLSLSFALAVYKEEIKETGAISPEEPLLMQYRNNEAAIRENEKPQYAPDELIVKFKPELGAKASKLFKEKRPFSSLTGTNSLDELNTKFKVKTIERVFKSLEAIGKLKGKDFLTAQEQATEVKNKFPKRTLRAPKDAKIPDLENIYLIKLAEGANILDAVAEYNKDPNVAYAEPNYINYSFTTPNDFYFNSYGSFGQSYDDLWGLKKIDSEQAWDISQGENVVIAVIDSGVDYTHEDIAVNMWINQREIPDNGIDDDSNGFTDDYYGYNFASDISDPMDGLGHGTHVSGTIAAVGNNTLGVVGVAPLAKIMAVKGLSDSGSGYASDLADGIIYAANMGADVLNNSWGYRTPGPASQAVKDAVDYAYVLGCIIVAAAGNSNADVGTPENGYGICTLPKVITVAASNQNDLKCSFSNYGDKIDVSAPGGGDEVILDNILSTMSEGVISGSKPELMVSNGYYRLAGTSMAAPHVSGLAALLVSQYPALTQEAARYILRDSADDVGDPGFDIYFGYGRINAHNSLLIDGIYMNGLTLNDAAGGDNNGNPDPGENVDLIIPLISVGEDATDVSATISSDNPYINIINNVSNYGSIIKGQEADNATNPFVVHINTDVPSGKIQFSLDVTANFGSYWRSFPFEVRVALPQELKILSGNNQARYKGTDLQEPLVVKFVDQEGYPISNHNVTFEVIEGNASLSNTNANTDFFGKALTNLTLGDLPPETKIQKNRIKATGEGLETHPVEFTAYATDFHINFKKAWSLKDNYPDFFGVYDYFVYSVETGDLDNDGHKEFYFGTYIHSSPSVKRMFIFEENGDDSYHMIWSYDTPFFVRSFAYGDIDNDGNNELVMGTYIGRIYVLDKQADNDFSINEIMYLYSPSRFKTLKEIKVADLNNDNIPELIICGETGDVSPDGILYIYRNTGAIGEYAFTKMYENRSNHGNSFIQIGDSDNDNNKEVVSGGFRGPTRIIRHEFNPSSANFDKKTNLISGIDVRPMELLISDLDGDSSIDVFAYGAIYLPSLNDEILFEIESLGDDSFVQTAWQYDLDDNYFIHVTNELKAATLSNLENPAIFIGASSYNLEKKGYCSLFTFFDGEYVPINSFVLNDTITFDLAIDDLDNDRLTDLLVVDGPTSYWGASGKNIVIFENKIVPILNPIGNKMVTEGRPLEFTITAIDLDNYPLAYSALGVPLGATFDTVTGRFYWPKATIERNQFGKIIKDTYQVIFGVTDGMYQDTETITIKVNALVAVPLPVAR